MKIFSFKSLILTILLLLSLVASAQEDVALIDEETSDDDFDTKEMIIHHIKDAYGFHIIDINEKPISIPLPVIVWTDNGLSSFMSSRFHHDSEGEVVVDKNGENFVNYHEKVYKLNPGADELMINEEGYPKNAKAPLDFSITRNVFMMLVSVLVILLIFINSAKQYKKTKDNVPKGIAKFTEPLVLFIRDEVAKPMIGEHKYKKYMPYLLTIFFFIWVNNIFGLMPVLNNANVSGNIAFTLTLAVFTFIITTFSGNKNYWKHILWMPGVPVPMKIFLIPIEIVGMFVKPVSLMIRLFANITAGHIIVLSLISLVFIFETVAVAPVSVVFSLFITLIEIVVTAIQAYIFTILSALYFGMATEENH